MFLVCRMLAWLRWREKGHPKSVQQAKCHSMLACSVASVACGQWCADKEWEPIQENSHPQGQSWMLSANNTLESHWHWRKRNVFRSQVYSDSFQIQWHWCNSPQPQTCRSEFWSRFLHFNTTTSKKCVQTTVCLSLTHTPLFCIQTTKPLWSQSQL